MQSPLAGTFDAPASGEAIRDAIREAIREPSRDAIQGGHQRCNHRRMTERPVFASSCSARSTAVTSSGIKRATALRLHPQRARESEHRSVAVGSKQGTPRRSKAIRGIPRHSKAKEAIRGTPRRSEALTGTTRDHHLSSDHSQSQSHSHSGTITYPRRPALQKHAIIPNHMQSTGNHMHSPILDDPPSKHIVPNERYELGPRA